MASSRTLGGDYGWRLGGTLRAVGSERRRPGRPRGQHPPAAVLTVVGLYRPRDYADPYWFAHPYFDARLGQGDKPDYVDAVFVAAVHVRRR